MKNLNTSYIFLSLVTVLLLSSCTRYRDMVYMRDLEKDSDESFTVKTYPDYRIQKQDILYIKIYNLNEEVSTIINQRSIGQSQNLFQNELSLFINGYTVSDSGYVEIPIIGKVNVLHKTIEEAKEEVQKQAEVYLKDAIIFLKLVSFKITVMGEVYQPGVYYNYNSQLTVLEAIGMAGDITDYGNRKKVLIIRPTKEGTNTFRLNLTKKDILASDGFFLLPNDIVYIEPIKSKSFKLNIPNMTLALSTITTLILILNYIAKN